MKAFLRISLVIISLLIFALTSCFVFMIGSLEGNHASYIQQTENHLPLFSQFFLNYYNVIIFFSAFIVAIVIFSIIAKKHDLQIFLGILMQALSVLKIILVVTYLYLTYQTFYM